LWKPAFFGVKPEMLVKGRCMPDWRSRLQWRAGVSRLRSKARLDTIISTTIADKRAAINTNTTEIILHRVA
jgi:hypothetical protein